ncbi:zinc finger protein [Loa loa]|uniref:Zinc finger protein n=1 Tax=Loa loa TaxID=7209 RepID=A0A1I7VCV3_LOALO|nr:zinc finger protein [Loa loa]EJD74521.1 zinc finger protein [Loa loa]
MDEGSINSRSTETVIKSVSGLTAASVEDGNNNPEQAEMVRKRLQACEIASVDVNEMVWEASSNDEKEKTFHELQPIKEKDYEFLVPSTSKKVLKRAQDITEERKNEHKRWRAAIDGYAQYSEWICKVNEKVEDMPDLDSGGSVATTDATDDPEAEYFIAVDSMKDVIDQIQKARAAQSEETAESDAKLDEILKYCEESAKRIGSFEDKNIQNYQMFICFACGRVFDDEIAMRNHINEIHLSNKDYIFKCSYCYRRFKLKHHLQRHERTHDLSLVHTCNRCSSSFRSFESLIVHKSKAHGIDENGAKILNLKYNCNKCKQKFGTFIELSRHKYFCLNESRIKEQKKVSGASPSSSTSSIFSLSSRQKVDKTCRICNTKFASRQSLIRHMGRIHPQEKIDEIKQYEVIQSPDLPFACNICSKRFTTRTLMLVHRKRHEGRHFVCEICKKTYPLASELRKHVKRVHGSSLEGYGTSKGSSAEYSSATAIDKQNLSKQQSLPVEQYNNCDYEDLTDFGDL